MLSVRVRTPRHPTETPERLIQAVRNLFPDATVEVGDHEVVAEARGLERLAELVRAQQIPDTARGIMLRGQRGNLCDFELGKQAAWAGRASFGSTDAPLGSLEVTVEASSEAELRRAIYHVAPDTTVPEELAEVPPEDRPDERG